MNIKPIIFIFVCLQVVTLVKSTSLGAAISELDLEEKQELMNALLNDGAEGTGVSQKHSLFRMNKRPFARLG